MLLYGHACEPHIHHLRAVARDLVPPEDFDQFFSDVTAARDWQSGMEKHERWIELAPGRFGAVDLDTLDQPASIREHLTAWLTRFIDYKPNGTLVLMGPVGSGKSWAAHAVARATSDDGAEVKLTTAGRMLRTLRPGGGASIEDYTVPTVLLIDDLGVEKSTEWTDETLFAIFDQRWQEERATIITTNLTPAALQDAVGDRVYDRIRDNATAITLTGPSRRSASIALTVTGGQ